MLLIHFKYSLYFSSTEALENPIFIIVFVIDSVAIAAYCTAVRATNI